MNFGKLTFRPVEVSFGLVAQSTKSMIEQDLPGIQVSEIDEKLADTAAFCEYYDVGLDVSANCVIVEAKRANTVWYAACVILATTKADVNGIIRRQLGARKISFAAMEIAVSLTNMKYGGITPIGLPVHWPILIDTKVFNTENVIIGSGLRSSKLLVPGSLLAKLPNATVMEITKSE